MPSFSKFVVEKQISIFWIVILRKFRAFFKDAMRKHPKPRSNGTDPNDFLLFLFVYCSDSKSFNILKSAYESLKERSDSTLSYHKAKWASVPFDEIYDSLVKSFYDNYDKPLNLAIRSLESFLSPWMYILFSYY